MPSFNPDKLKRFLESLPIKFRTNEKFYILTCPRCMKKDKLYIHKAKAEFICWRCGEDGFKGKVEFALAELAGISLQAARQVVYDEFGELHGPPSTFVEVDMSGKPKHEAVNPIVALAEEAPRVHPPDHYLLDDPRAARGARYLEGRGIPTKLAMRYGIRYCPPEERVIFPVCHGDKLLGWQGRSIGAGQPKILSSAGIRREFAVMFSHRLERAPHAVVCEGPVDAIKAHFCRGNVATMGKVVSAGQAQLMLSGGVRRVYLALDPDAASQIPELVDKFAPARCFVVQIPNKFKDLGEMSFAEVLHAFRAAQPALKSNVYVHLA